MVRAPEMDPAAGALAGFLFAAALVFFINRRTLPIQTLDSPAIVRQIQGLSELVSVKYTVQKVVGLEEKKKPVGSEKLLLIVQAEVLGGGRSSGVETRQSPDPDGRKYQARASARADLSHRGRRQSNQSVGPPDHLVDSVGFSRPPTSNARRACRQAQQ